MQQKGHRCPSRTFSPSSLWYIVPVDLCVNRFTSDRIVVSCALFALVSVARTRMIKKQPVLLYILQFQAFRSFLWHGLSRSTWEWSIRNAAKSRRFALNMFFVVSPIFPVFFMFSWKMNSRNISVCFSSFFLPLQWCALIKWPSYLNLVCLRISKLKRSLAEEWQFCLARAYSRSKFLSYPSSLYRNKVSRKIILNVVLWHPRTQVYNPVYQVIWVRITCCLHKHAALKKKCL